MESLLCLLGVQSKRSCPVTKAHQVRPPADEHRDIDSRKQVAEAEQLMCSGRKITR